jgi:polygalacturonase
MAWRRRKNVGERWVNRRLRSAAAVQAAVVEALEGRVLFSSFFNWDALSVSSHSAGKRSAPSTTTVVANLNSNVQSDALTGGNITVEDDSAPTLPVITGPTFNITSYGAVGDSATNNTTDIQNCINAASAAAVSETNSHSNLTGAVVLIPSASGTFLSGPLTVPSNINLEVTGTLQMLPYGTYPSGSNEYFLYFNNDTNVEITGTGRIDGQGAAWWTAFKNSGISRPDMIKFNGTNVVLIQGVTVSNAPTENISLDSTNNVTINDITISEPIDTIAPNTDGIDPAGMNYLIENCNISCGDDDIAIKAESTTCGNIMITGCTIGYGHGVGVGGQTQAGLNGLTITNCTFTNTEAGIRLKASRGTGGPVQNITVSNITMSGVKYPIDITSYYTTSTWGTGINPQDPIQASNSLTPIWKNISISTLTSTMTTSDMYYSGSYSGIIWGLPEQSVIGMTLTNVQISGNQYGLELDHVRSLTFSNVNVSPATGNDLISDPTASVPYDADATLVGWTDADIGSPSGAGSVIYNPDNANWTVNGGGAGITGASDKFNLASTSISGNVSISADVTSQTNTNAGAEAGVMVRESTAANAAFAEAVVTPSDGILFAWRASDGASVQSTMVSGAAAKYLRITRIGNSFSAYDSSNGTSWALIGTETITMNAGSLAGLAVTANSSSTSVSTAVFTNVNVDTGPVISTAAAANPSPVTGTSTVLSVAATDVLGNSGLTYTWSNTGNAVAFSSNGTNSASTTTATFAEAGVYDFTVTVTDSAGLSTTSTVDVTVNQTPTTVTVSPASPSVPAGSRQQFSATAYDQFNNVISGQSFNWSVTGSGNSIDNTGLLTLGDTFGNYTVMATDGSAQGTTGVTATQVVTSVTVSPASPSVPAGSTEQFSATAYDQFDNPMNGQSFTWSVTGNGNSIDNTGLLTLGDTFGNYTVMATDGSAQGTTGVTSTQVVTSVTVSPASPSAPAGSTEQFSATAYDQFDDAMSGQSFTWSVTGSGNSIDNTGLLTLGDTFGTFTVTATDGSVQGTAGVTATQVVTNVTVSPASSSVADGGTEQFSATAYDQFDNPMSGQSFDWSVTGSDNSIDGTGLLTAGQTPGDYTVTAADGSVQGTADVMAVAAPTITGFMVNDGSAQRAMVDSLTITFSEPVILSAGAITLSGQSTAGGAWSPFNFNLTNPSGDDQTYVLTFTNLSYLGNSLPDGDYNVTVSASQVQNSVGSNLAGGDQTFSFYRLYGDFLGAGLVNFADLLVIAQNFNQPPPYWYLSISGNNTVNFGDLLGVAQNFNKTSTEL